MIRRRDSRTVTRDRGRRCAALAVLAAAAVSVWAGAGKQGGSWRRHTIDKSSRGADGVRLADVNGDGRPDIVTGWEEGGVTRAYLNPGARKAASQWPAVTIGKTKSVEDAVFVDLDADGAVDVVSSCEGSNTVMYVHWAPANKNKYLSPDAWRTAELATSKKKMRWMFAVPMQVDGKRGVDIVAGGKDGAAQVGWWEAPANPRDVKTWTWHPLCDAGWIMSLVAADMDGDGDEDILASDRKGSGRGCFWLENPGAAAVKGPWARHDIGGAGKEVMFLTVADLDADGLDDVLVAVKPDRFLFLRRLARDGRSWKTHAIRVPPGVGTPKAVRVGDVNLDGRADIVFSCENATGAKHGVKWLSYRKAPTDAEWDAHDISGPEGVKFDLVQMLDVDGDGDPDVLTCEERTNLGVVWYENPARRLPARRGLSSY